MVVVWTNAQGKLKRKLRYYSRFWCISSFVDSPTQYGHGYSFSDFSDQQCPN